MPGCAGGEVYEDTAQEVLQRRQGDALNFEAIGLNLKVAGRLLRAETL